VNLGVVQTLDQLKQLVYRPAAVKVMRILDCHAVVGFGGGERVNDWSKPSRGSRGFKEREEDSRWMSIVLGERLAGMFQTKLNIAWLFLQLASAHIKGH